MYLLKYFLLLIYVIKSLKGLTENVTYPSIGWPFQFNAGQQLDQPADQNLGGQNLPVLLSLYKDYHNNFIQIDDDSKYDRENQSPIDESPTEGSKANGSMLVNKSESELRPTVESAIRPTIDPIVPIIKRMLRRKDIRKEYPNYEPIKRRKGSSSASYGDETSRSSSNKVYNDEDDGHSTYGQEDEEEEEPYYEDDSWAKKSGYSAGHHHHGSAHLALPLHDHYYTGSSGVPAYYGWNSHGHYYPYYAQPYHGHHYVGKHLYGKHLYKEEYAIILVVISLAAFLGLIFSMLMPYALIQSQAITGVPSNTVPYTNAVTTLGGNQFSNAAVSTDVNRIMNPFGRRRRKRMIRFDAMQYLDEQLNGHRRCRAKKVNRNTKDGHPGGGEYVPLSNFLESLYQSSLADRRLLLDFAARTTYNLLNNL